MFRVQAQCRAHVPDLCRVCRIVNIQQEVVYANCFVCGDMILNMGWHGYGWMAFYFIYSLFKWLISANRVEEFTDILTDIVEKVQPLFIWTSSDTWCSNEWPRRCISWRSVQESLACSQIQLSKWSTSQGYAKHYLVDIPPPWDYPA